MESISDIFDYQNSRQVYKTIGNQDLNTVQFDVTFLVQLRIDSADRKENADTIIPEL